MKRLFSARVIPRNIPRVNLARTQTTTSKPDTAVNKTNNTFESVFDNEAEKPAFAGEEAEDLTSSFKGISTDPFPKEVQDALLQPVDLKDIECKPGTTLLLGTN
jgi:hypothetical protein